MSLLEKYDFKNLLHSWLQRMKFIRKYLRATDLVTDRQSVKKFVHKFLGFDGIFCMRMISAHSGDIMASFDVFSRMDRPLRGRQQKLVDHGFGKIDLE